MGKLLFVLADVDAETNLGSHDGVSFREEGCREWRFQPDR
jgi:hypothetical protein